MSNSLLEKLEKQIENAVGLIELLRLQVEELEGKHQQLQHENSVLKKHQSEWEQSLSTLLRKLDSAHLSTDKIVHHVNEFEREEEYS
jgi:FtsZ-binding cell division protein ZapB